MTSSSHGIVTLPIWSETTTAAPQNQRWHRTDGFITVVLYPRRTPDTLTVKENGLVPGHQQIFPQLPGLEVDNQQEQEEDEETPYQEEITLPTNQDPLQSKIRFWTEDTPTSRAAASPMPSTKNKHIAVIKSTKSEWSLDKGSIAAVVIISIVTVSCLAFLGYWYVARECKARRRRRRRASETNPFDQSSVTLGDETSRTLDEFLLKDVEPERASLMFSRSRSPSLAYVVDEADRQSAKASSRNSYEAHLNSVLRMDPLRVSTDDPRPSFVISELTDSSTSKSGSRSSGQKSRSSASKNGSTPTSSSNETPNISQSNSSASKHSSTPPTSLSIESYNASQHTSPRVSVTSTAPPATTRSSQLWATTSADTTEKSSLMGYDQSPRSSLSISRSSNISPGYTTSQLPSRSQHASNASQSSSHYSRSLPRMINDAGASRRNHERSSYSAHSRTMTISPIAESSSIQSDEYSPSSTAPSSRMFRFSDAT